MSAPCGCVLCRRGIHCPAFDPIVIELPDYRCTLCGVTSRWPTPVRHRQACAWSGR